MGKRDLLAARLKPTMSRTGSTNASLATHRLDATASPNWLYQWRRKAGTGADDADHAVAAAS